MDGWVVEGVGVCAVDGSTAKKQNAAGRDNGHDSRHAKIGTA